MQSEYHHVQEPVSTAQPGMPVGADMPGDMVPIIEVSFRNGMWWSMPPEMSAEIYKKYMSGENAGYTWDWGDSRKGSWQPDDERASINRHVIDFGAMEQTNIDNNRKRSVRIVWTATAVTQPQWSGEIPNGTSDPRR